MFDKIPSLKDFVLYLMPGIIISFLSLDVLNLLFPENFDIKKIDNNSLSFIFIVSSFLVGFFSSQVQMILFGLYLKDRLDKMRTIDEAFKDSEDLKLTIIKKIKNVFNLENEFGNDSLIIFSCMSYIKSKANDGSQLYVERNNYLSSFAMTLVLPITLAILDILLRAKLEKIQILVILLISTLIIIYILIKIICNFRDEFYKNIFRQFLVTE